MNATVSPAAREPRLRGRTLVLASTSRYRKELLERLGLPFATARPNTDESPREGERPADTAIRLAEAKARSVAHAWREALIIGSDQVADCDGDAIGKPGTADAARTMLARLAGREVVFHTGLALLDATTGACRTVLVDVRSTFRPLTAAEIDAYVAREPALDCAGGVKIEALGIALFSGVESDDPTALVGLPLIRLTDMLLAAGVRPLG